MASQQTSLLTRRLIPLALIALLGALLSACGGYPDEDERARTAGASTLQPQPSGDFEPVTLAIPKAPTPGEVLYADARILRPLADEALWVYRGLRTNNGKPTHYSSFRQTSRTADGYQERLSSPLTNASRVRNLIPGSAQIGLDETLSLPAGIHSVRTVELRSPVRLGEQINVFEGSGIALAEDIDGDGKTDSLDLAAWSLVVGDEDVELPELERTVRALRVDTTVSSRLRRSSKPEPDAVLTVVESTWYSAGIGIVRTSRTQPSTQGPGPVESDERLQLWDGISTGMGLIPSSPVSVSGASAAIAPWLALPQAAVRQGSRVFLLSAAPSARKQSMVLSVLNGRGRVEHSVEHGDLAATNQPFAQLVPLGSGVGVVQREHGVLLYPEQLENLKLVRFDDRAQRVGRDVWLVDGAVAGSLNAASDGETVWVTWVDPGTSGQSRRLMLQGFDVQGDIRTRTHVLETPDDGVHIDRITLTAGQGRVMVHWRAQSGTGVTWRTALGNTVSAPRLATLAAATPANANAAATLTPLLTESIAAFSWTQPLDRHNGLVAPRAVALDEAAQVRRAASGGLDQELLALPAGSLQFADRTVTAAEDKRVLWAAAGVGRLRGETDAQDRTLVFATVEAADAALSAARPQLKRLRDSSPATSWQGTVQALHQIVPMDDRWMIIGHDGRFATVAILHRH